MAKSTKSTSKRAASTSKSAKSKAKLSTKKPATTAAPYRMRTRERELLNLVREMKSSSDTGAAVATFSERIDKTLSRYDKK